MAGFTPHLEEGVPLARIATPSGVGGWTRQGGEHREADDVSSDGQPGPGATDQTGVDITRGQVLAAPPVQQPRQVLPCYAAADWYMAWDSYTYGEPQSSCWDQSLVPRRYSFPVHEEGR